MNAPSVAFLKGMKKPTPIKAPKPYRRPNKSTIGMSRASFALFQTYRNPPSPAATVVTPKNPSLSEKRHQRRLGAIMRLIQVFRRPPTRDDASDCRDKDANSDKRDHYRSILLKHLRTDDERGAKAQQ